MRYSLYHIGVIVLIRTIRFVVLRGVVWYATISINPNNVQHAV